jgi:hypothetical protein
VKTPKDAPGSSIGTHPHCFNTILTLKDSYQPNNIWFDKTIDPGLVWWSIRRQRPWLFRHERVRQFGGTGYFYHRPDNQAKWWILYEA